MKKRFVYAMVCEPVGGLRFVKFGLTSSVYSRAQTLQNGCPLYIERAISVEVGDDVTQRFIEASLHCEFEQMQSAGEWFRFPDCEEFQKSIDRSVLDVVQRVGYSNARLKQYKFKRPEDRRAKARRGHDYARKAYSTRPGAPAEYDVVVGAVKDLPPVTNRRRILSSFKESLKDCVSD